MNSTIAAVVVTFNRKNLLIECLDSLLNQTKKIDKIFIIDNASSDGTQELLRNTGYLNHEQIEYHLMPQNIGGAGGFAEGVRIARAANFDWIWVMDDDAEPLPEALAALVPHMYDRSTVAVCPALANASGILEGDVPHRGWFAPYKNDRMVRTLKLSELAGKKSVEIDHCSFVGLCFRASVIDTIGLPKKEFFIHYDDSEFCSRLRKIGKIHLIVDAVIKHKDAAAVGLVKQKNMLGRTSSRIEYEKLWLKFYGYRNRTWMIFNKKVEGAFYRVVLEHIRKNIGVILYDDHKIKRLIFWNTAFWDGIRGNFDNTKPRRILS